MLVRRCTHARPWIPRMNFISTAALAMAMSTDAFAAAVGKGTALHKPRWSEALRTGAIFGIIEAITPLAGWALGLAAVNTLKAWDHWIAFGLSGALLMVAAGVALLLPGRRPPALPTPQAAG